MRAALEAEARACGVSLSSYLNAFLTVAVEAGPLEAMRTEVKKACAACALRRGQRAPLAPSETALGQMVLRVLGTGARMATRDVRRVIGYPRAAVLSRCLALAHEGAICRVGEDEVGEDVWALPEDAPLRTT